jgi:copper chaperone CopZ
MNQQDDHSPHLLEKTVPIKGMHCASCELLIAEELESIPGVTSAQASLKTSSATIVSAEQVSDKDIESAVQAAGYEVGYESGQKPFFTHNERIWKDFAIGIIVVLGLYVLFQVLGIDKLVSSTSNSTSTGTMALLVGLTAGFSTCMALIGGLVISVAAKYAENHPTETALQKFRPHLFFNAGRIVSFIAFGAIIGAIGSAFALKGTFLGLLTIAVGAVMLVLGLQLTEIFPRITRGLALPSGLAKKLGINTRKEREYSHKNAFLMGAATLTEHCSHHENNTIRIATVEKGLEVAEEDVKALYMYKNEHGKQLEELRSDVQAIRIIMETGFKEQTKQICDIKNTIIKMISDRIEQGDRAVEESKKDREDIKKQLSALNKSKWFGDKMTEIRDSGFWWICKLLMILIGIGIVVDFMYQKFWDLFSKVIK